MTANPGKKSKFERFHGAFTGGFSAGYFNTVGSENNAGFQPSTFVSSRSNRSVHSIYLFAPFTPFAHLSPLIDPDSSNAKITTSGSTSLFYCN